ncbi:MAG: HlyC/CorC family transporter [Eggerthellaceae bacterium]|nr:HlyC/CorC family transporter [Eggerthellaceae bacterium]
MSVTISLLLVVFFLAMNAFFVVAEFACVRVRKSQLELAAEEGKRGAKNALIIAENVNAYLGACQLGITLASLALGWLGEPAISQLIRPLLEPFDISATAISGIAIAIGYIIMTALHVVIGELIPKSFAIFSTAKYALRTATPLRWFYRITYPIMWVFNSLTNGVVRLFGHDPSQVNEAYTEEELQHLAAESTESGLIDSERGEYVDNIFELREKDVEDIMTPRTDMVCLDLEDTWDENLERIMKYKFTRYPVCRESKDRILGFVHVKDLYTTQLPDRDVNKLNVRPIVAVPEGLSVAKLIQTFQEKRTKIAVVIDEFGGTAGIVTMSDIMDEIVGRSDDEYRHDFEEEVETLQEGVYRIDGSVPMDEVVELIGFEPDEADEYTTAGGLLLGLFDRIPSVGDEISVDDGERRATFTVLEMDRLRIEEIKCTLSDVPVEEQG